MDPDSAVVIENTLVKMAQVLNRFTEQEPNVTHSNTKDNSDEKSVYDDSYMLKH